MSKQTSDYDNVFKTMKSKHKRLFIPVINEVFGKNYPLDVKVDILETEGYLTDNETEDGSEEIQERVSDFLIRIGEEIYLLECQSYDDDSIAIRLAEYAFISAGKAATWGNGYADIKMPSFAVIYIKRSNRTPEKTTIKFTFPDGQTVIYESKNVILDQFTKEYIIDKRLYPYIPFYIARYEKELTNAESGNLESAIKDLEYFRDEMCRLHEEGELSDYDYIDLTGFVNTIIRHITDGNKNEGRLVKIMGGTVIETESERLIKEGRKEGRKEGENALIELYATLKRLGRDADADKAMTDSEARMRLYKELGIGH
jgi:hypothetical protein